MLSYMDAIEIISLKRSLIAIEELPGICKSPVMVLLFQLSPRSVADHSQFPRHFKLMFESMKCEINST